MFLFFSSDVDCYIPNLWLPPPLSGCNCGVNSWVNSCLRMLQAILSRVIVNRFPLTSWLYPQWKTLWWYSFAYSLRPNSCYYNSTQVHTSQNTWYTIIVFLYEKQIHFIHNIISKGKTKYTKEEMPKAILISKYCISF